MSKKLIHFPFYCNQYLGVMSELSAKERGFWITLLATYVVSDGLFPSKKRLYKRCDACTEDDEKIIDELLPEIEEIGKGIIKKQKKLSKTRAKSGSKGGKANAKQMLSKKSAKSQSKDKHTETDTELKKEPNNKYSPEFEEIWISYDRKGSKQLSWLEFKKTTKYDFDNIKKGIKLYKDERPDKQYRKNFECFLKRKIFEDCIERYAAKKLGDFNNVFHDMIRSSRLVEFFGTFEQIESLWCDEFVPANGNSFGDDLSDSEQKKKIAEFIKVKLEESYG